MSRDSTHRKLGTARAWVFVVKGRPEFRKTRQYVLRSSDLQLHDRFLSDHYMIKVSVKDYVDDADPRTKNAPA